MKEKVICYIMVYAMDFFYSLEFLDFFNQSCSYLLEKIMGERGKSRISGVKVLRYLSSLLEPQTLYQNSFELLRELLK